MNAIDHVIRVLKDPAVRNLFLAILSRNRSNEEKYKEFLDYFETEGRLLERFVARIEEVTQCPPGERTSKFAEALSAAAQDIDIWKPEEIVEKTRESVRRAITRIHRCQHPDGGWGYRYELSNVWGTAHALLGLMAADESLNMESDTEDRIRWGIAWLNRHRGEWYLERLPPAANCSVFEASLAARTLLGAVQERRCDLGQQVQNSIWNLLRAQNADGGWDATVWKEGRSDRAGIFSEVGATSMALQAAVAWGGLQTFDEFEGRSEFHDRVSDGLHWLAKTQKEDGSWNAGSCDPIHPKPQGQPSITKTCDAIQGILGVSEYLGKTEFSDSITKAVNWILSQERLLPEDQSHKAGWGFYDETAFPMADLDSTCLTLETLVRTNEVFLPFVSVNALWLIKAQHAAPGDIEDGKWAGGDTFRIALGLIRYYQKIIVSPLFQPIPPPVIYPIRDEQGKPPSDAAAAGGQDAWLGTI
jgi:hypothetical protein